ncbi:MAG: ATP-binding protein [Deltaproteobacteria bacterium]|nr:MAG: ATP-binding protein [Deltaproteobacteria bacterium]
MKDLLAWFGLKRFPFDKNIKPTDVLDTEPMKECAARLDYIKRRGGIMLLTGDPGVGKTLVLRRYVDSLNENLFKVFYTPLSTLSRADLLYHINRLLGLTPRLSKSAIYLQIQKALIDSNLKSKSAKPSSSSSMRPTSSKPAPWRNSDSSPTSRWIPTTPSSSSWPVKVI